MRALFISGSFFDVFVQLIGFAAMGIGIISFQARRRNTILFIQLCANILWTTQFILLGSYTGAALNVIAAVRAFVYMKKDKYKWGNSIFVPISMIIASAIAGIVFFKSYFDILPIIAMATSSIALFMDDEKKIRILSLFGSPMWLVYDVLEHTIAGTLCEVFNICSIIIAMFRFRKINKKESPKTN